MWNTPVEGQAPLQCAPRCWYANKVHGCRLWTITDHCSRYTAVDCGGGAGLVPNALDFAERLLEPPDKLQAYPEAGTRRRPAVWWEMPPPAAQNQHVHAPEHSID
uniref:Uncharacterized protein n=1 Tax=Knipowitschia caucasica TaxID=637954 RepID=A0AAV2MHZ4_KNICA